MTREEKITFLRGVAESMDTTWLTEVLDDYEDIYGDPAKVFYAELVMTVKAIADELRILRDPMSAENALKTPVIRGEDRTFERIALLLKEADKIFSGLQKGRAILESEDDGDSSSVIKDRKGKTKNIAV